MLRQFQQLRIKGEEVSTIDWEKDIPQPEHNEDAVAVRPKRTKPEGVAVDAGKQTAVRAAAEQGDGSAQGSEPERETSKGKSSGDTAKEREDQGEDSKDGPSLASPTIANEGPQAKRRCSRPKGFSPKAPEPEDSMTWQEHEITGHLNDDPDDDGEGMNGIGFIPTAAMADARTQRRRQQVQEYKNREAREARRLRGVRRRAEPVEAPVADSPIDGRKVRFAEVENG